MKRSDRQKGSVVFMIILMLSILSLIPISLQMTNLSNQKTKFQLSHSVQATNAARGGLEDAILWFKRQGIQPVRNTGLGFFSFHDAAFYPRNSPVEAIQDTIDEGIGLVKEYPLNEAGNLWARYEVKRQSQDWTTPGNEALYDATAVHDVSPARIAGAASGSGLAWSIVSTGYIFQRHNHSVPFNAEPNKIVAKSVIQGEIMSIGINLPPARAALYVTDFSSITQISTAASLSSINGGTQVGMVCALNAPDPADVPAFIRGEPRMVVVSTPSLPTAVSLFGVNERQLRNLADYSVVSIDEMPNRYYPGMGIVYVNGDAVFNDGAPLRGGGVLYVKGNLSVSDPYGTFSGVIYVTGDAYIRGPFTHYGTLIVLGNLVFDNTGGNAVIQYNTDTLANVRSQIAQYRENHGNYMTFAANK